eukprot:4848080-Lingulodinium_polyedra.AAC.1
MPTEPPGDLCTSWPSYGYLPRSTPRRSSCPPCASEALAPTLSKGCEASGSAATCTRPRT